jgi:hypothetical protein
MSCPLLTLSKLTAGINKFQARPRWRRDFHNDFYATVTDAIRVSGTICAPSPRQMSPPGTNTWDDVVKELSFWKALRPLTQAHFLTHSGRSALDKVYSFFGKGHPYKPLPAMLNPQNPVVTIFREAQKLKPVNNRSPVFPSKCCHMLLPWEFPVWDGNFIGPSARHKMIQAIEEWKDLDPETSRILRKNIQSGANYWCYRAFLLTAWDTAAPSLQSQLIATLNRAMPKNTCVWTHFPYRTKIPELCLA